MPNTIEQRAIAAATLYLTKRGYAVEDVSKKREHRGYDLIAEQNGASLKIEVKGCSRLWGIPDPYLTEFDANRKLIADFLYVVYFIDGEEPTVCTIPRDAIKPEFVMPKQSYGVSARFKNEATLKPFLHAI